MARISSPKGRTRTLAPPKEASIGVRKIENGYVVTESGMRRGKYYSKETFTKTPPKIKL